VQRLSELAQLYGVPLERLLPQSPGRREDRPQRGRGREEAPAGIAGTLPEKVVIDLVALERHTDPELETIRRYVDAIKLRRGDFNGRVLSVRSADVWACAAMSNLQVEDFVHELDRLEILQRV
jgi:hypothetical protein